MKRSYSIFRIFLIIAFLTVVTIISLAVWETMGIYKAQKEHYSLLLSSVANKIGNTIEDDLNYTKYQLKYLTLQIKNEGADLDFINKLLQSFKNTSNLNIALSWNMFSWINNNKELIIDGKEGILPKAIDLSFRDYLNCTFIHPDKFCLGTPIIGAISKQYIIPAAMGVVDRENKFIGTVVLGIDIKSMMQKLEQLTSVNSGISFLITDRDFKPIFYSTSMHDPNHADDLIEQIQNHSSYGLVSAQKIFSKYPGYVYHQKMSDFPFIIIVSYDVSKSFNQFLIYWSSRMLEFLLFAFAIITLLYRLYIKIITPITLLAKSTSQISQGNIDIKLPKTQISELNQLEKEITNIVSYIAREAKAKEELEEKKLELEFAYNHIRENKVQLEKMIDARTNELHKALSVKTEFFNNMSHEIRTPIQGITTLSEGLVEHWSDFEERKKFTLAENVAKNSKRLFSLVSNLLDFSRLNAHGVTLNLQKTNILDLIQDMIDECRSLYVIDKPIELKFKSHQLSSAEILLDAEKITQVLRNLFANAVKFTQAGVITISLKEESLEYEDCSMHPSIFFSISDHGIGIPEEELEAIFDPFVQSSRTKNKAGGTGLGLAICREIIEAHHGIIWATNNNPGANISFILPLDLDNLLNHKVEKKAVKATSKKIKKTTNKIQNILVIDDEEACLMSLDLILHDTGYKIYKATNGLEGLQFLQKSKPKIDLILLDLMLPDMHGIDVLKAIKADQKTSNIKVVLQSGSDDQNEIAKATAHGVDSFLRKPFQREDLFKMLESL